MCTLTARTCARVLKLQAEMAVWPGMPRIIEEAAMLPQTDQRLCLGARLINTLDSHLQTCNLCLTYYLFASVALMMAKYGC